jgi:hypothetical protein
MKMVIAAIIIAIIAVGGFLAYWMLIGPGKGSGSNSWMFKGAYADFQGQASASGYTMNVTMHIEVLDYNSTQAKILTATSVDYGLGPPITSNQTSWVDTSKNDYNLENGNLTDTYSTTVTLTNLGSRSCTAYVYSSTGMTLTVYVDNNDLFPVKISETSESYNLDLLLVSTNIPGL